jgi:hypothetical protein
LKIDQGGLTSPDLVVTQKAEEKQMGKFSKPHGDVQDKLKVSDFLSTTLKIDTWEVRGIYFAMNREPVSLQFFLSRRNWRSWGALQWNLGQHEHFNDHVIKDVVGMSRNPSPD